MTEVAVITVPVEEWQETKAILRGISDQVAKLTAKDQKELLTIPEARELLSISKTTMERYINDSVLEVTRLNGKSGSKRYIKRSEIEAKIASGAI